MTKQNMDLLVELETMRKVVMNARFGTNYIEFERAHRFMDSALRNSTENISYLHGDLLESHANIIVHQVNCMGVMGAGLARQIRSKWPNVYNEYRALCDEVSAPRDLMGKAQMVSVEPGCSVANCFAQQDYRRAGQNICLTDYGSLSLALNEVREFATSINARAVALPFELGCGLAGGDCNIVRDIIDEALGNTAFEVKIYKK